jgi:FlaA1/EpsC-like NDP-sugar epimerase
LTGGDLRAPDSRAAKTVPLPNEGDPMATGEHEQRHDRPGGRPYLRFAAMIVTSAVLMYVVMYFNTYAIDHVYFSWTRLFMTMMSVSVMALVMLWFMRRMYRSSRANLMVVGLCVVVFGAGLWLARTQATISDRGWLEGMIPHHSIAILTSENANLTDPRVKDLARRIIEAQQAEIQEMKGYLRDIP